MWGRVYQHISARVTNHDYANQDNKPDWYSCLICMRGYVSLHVPRLWPTFITSLAGWARTIAVRASYPTVLFYMAHPFTHMDVFTGIYGLPFIP